MFGTRLKILREEKEITQKQLASVLQISRSTVAGYETKGKEADFEKIIVMSNYFDVSIDYLLGKTDCRLDVKTRITTEDELNILNLKFIEYDIIPKNDKLTFKRLDEYLKKFSIIANLFRD